MKKLLLLNFFLLFTHYAFTQCQSIETVITNSIPAVMPADTGWIDLCVGETLFLEGMSIYSENGQTYQQTDSTSTFKWTFGDGNEAVGISINHIYENPGAYILNLKITDTLGCINQTFLNQRVRVHGFPSELPTFISTDAVCEGNAITLKIATATSTIYNFDTDTLFINTDTLLIPDGDGSSVSTTINVNGFPEGTILENTNQLKDICLNIEHSWMRDLVIELTAPNGSTIILHDHPGQTGGQVFLGEPVDNDGGFPQLGIGYDYCWSADAPNPTWIEYSNVNFPGTIPAGIYSSFDPISDLLGTPLNGNWTLTITDLWAADNGALFYWSLFFDHNEIIINEAETFEVALTTSEWLPDNSIIFSNQDSLVATPTTTTIYTYQTTDNFGCTQFFDYEILVISANDAACQPCDSTIVSLPETLAFECTNNGSNTLTADVQSPSNDLDFQWITLDGEFTNPDQLNMSSVDILTAGTYILTTSIPASGCSQADTLLVTPTILPNLNAGEDTTLFCQIPQYFSLMGSTNGTDISFPLWTTADGEITFGANTFNPTIGEPGTYFLTILDNVSNCLLRDTVEVLLHPQLIDSLATTNATCDESTGTATIYSAANPANLSINWSNGETTSMITDLAPDFYTVTVTDDNCTQEGVVFVEEDACDVTIRGRIFLGEVCHPDSANLDWDPTLIVKLSPLNLEVTELNAVDGVYEFNVPPGDYVISTINDGSFPGNSFGIVCPVNNSIEVSLPTAGDISEENNFYWNAIVGTNDLNQQISLLRISQNPTNGHFQVNYTLPVSTAVSLKVFTLSGKLAMPVFENQDQTAGDHTKNSSIENLPNGVYILRLETADAVFFERIVKQ